jgi:hypothetical protein
VGPIFFGGGSTRGVCTGAPPPPPPPPPLNILDLVSGYSLILTLQFNG